MMVEVGLVEGVMEPITPKGACSMIIIPLLPVSQLLPLFSSPQEMTAAPTVRLPVIQES